MDCDETPKIIVGMECSACGSPFAGTFSTEMVDRLGAAGVTTEEVTDRIRGGLLSQQIMCKACLAARSN